MASIAKRRRYDGSLGYQVHWRQDGGWQSDTFASQRAAERFRRDVEDSGPVAGRLGFGRWRASHCRSTCPRCPPER